MKDFLIDISVLIEFFVRPETLANVFERVKQARPSRLFLYQDGPREGHPTDVENMRRCRDIVSDIDWECDVQTFYQEKNMGCDPSGYIAQTWAFSHTDKCIVLEDDVVPSLSFFAFCKEMLDRYENDERVMLISGMNYDEETQDIDEDYFFTSAILIWGWASWSRVVNNWDCGYGFLQNDKVCKRMNRMVQLNHAKNFINQCRYHQRSGIAHFETILISNQYLNHGLTLIPRKNQILNIGLSDEATHFTGSIHDVPKGLRPIFSLKQYEIKSPCLRHPTYVFDHIPYRERVYRMLGWRHPWVKVYRYLEISVNHLMHGDLYSFVKDTYNKMVKIKNGTSSI